MKVASLPLTGSAVSVTERSDDLGGQIPTDLRLLAIRSLETNPIFRGRLAWSAIQIESDGNTLVLNGRVPSYYLKQLLQETLRRVEGVAQVENHLVVVNPSDLLSTG